MAASWVAPRAVGVRVRGVAAIATALSVALSAVTVMILDSARPTVASPSAAHTQPANFRQAYGQLPMSFEPNVGQIQASARFLAHGAGYTALLSPTGVTLSGIGGADIEMKLLGADSAAALTGEDALPGVVNYLIGRSPAHWHTGVPTFGEVVERGAYPGIDVAYHSDGHELEYDFVVAAGGDPGVIGFRFMGVRGLSIDASTGDLVLTTAAGSLRHHAPRIYQVHSGAERPVSGRFIMRGSNDVGFQVAAYDHSRALVIDPTLAYSTYLGGSGPDEAVSVAVDRFGNAYVAGGTCSSDFPTAHPEQSAFKGGPICHYMAPAGGDAVVAKLNPSGSALIYSTYLGGTSDDEAFGLAVDSNGDAFVTGRTGSTDFPVTQGAFQTSCHLYSPQFPICLNAAFLAELNGAGTALLYSTYLGGATGGTSSSGIALGPGGTVYVSGSTQAPDFPTTPGAFQKQCAGSCNDSPFVAKLDPTKLGDGTGVPSQSNQALVYSSFLGGTNFDQGEGIAVDPGGNAYLTGIVTSPDFPTTAGAFQSTLAGPSDAFAAILDPSQSGDGSGIPSTTNPALVYSTYLGGSNGPLPSGSQFSIGRDIGVGIAVGPRVAGGSRPTAYVTGQARSVDFPVTQGAFETSLSSCSDNAGCAPFFSRINPAGGGHADLVYSTFVGGNGQGDAVAVDAAGNAVLTGETNLPNFPTMDTLQEMCCTTSSVPDVFVAKIAPRGGGTHDLLYSTFLGGSGTDGTSFPGGSGPGMGLALDTSGDIYIAGSTDSPQTDNPGVTGGLYGPTPIPYPTTPHAFQRTNGGGTCNNLEITGACADAFISKISSVCTRSLSGTVRRQVVVASGQALCLNGADVLSTITVNSGGDLSLDNSTVHGSVLADGATSVTVCGSTITGSVAISRSAGFVRVGSGDAPGCFGNTVGGRISLKANTAGAEVGGNQIGGSVVVANTSGNGLAQDDSVPEIEGNTIAGSLSCSGNAPAPGNDNQPNTVSGSEHNQCKGL